MQGVANGEGLREIGGTGTGGAVAVGLQADDEVEAATAVRRNGGDAVLAADVLPVFLRDGDFDEGGVGGDGRAVEAQVVDGLGTFGVEQGTRAEGGVVRGCLDGSGDGEVVRGGELLLPVADGLRVEVVHGGEGARGGGAEAFEFAVKGMAVGAVVRVAFVAKCQQVVAGVGKRCTVFAQGAGEAHGVVGRIAFAGGAGDEDEGFVVEGFHGVVRVPGVEALRGHAELRRQGAGEGFSLTALAGVEQEQRAVVVACALRAAAPQPDEPGKALCGDEEVGEGWIHAGVSVGRGLFFGGRDRPVPEIKPGRRCADTRMDFRDGSVVDAEEDDDERDADAGGRPQPGAAALFAVVNEQR